MSTAAAEFNPRLSPFVVVDAETPWLLRVRSGGRGVEATLTDLCGYYVGILDVAAVRSQVAAWGGADSAEIVTLLHACLDDDRRGSKTSN